MAIALARLGQRLPLARSFSTAGVGGYTSPASPFISAAEVDALLQDASGPPFTDAKLRVVDFGILSGASHVLKGAWPLGSVPSFKSAVKSGHSSEGEEVGAEAASLAVNQDTTVLITDAAGALPTARLWWALKAYGVTDVRVPLRGLDGVTALVPPPTEIGQDDILPAVEAAVQGPPLFGAPHPEHIVTPEQATALGAGDGPGAGVGEVWTVLDARSPAEFEGVDLRGNAAGGHIPGALNIPHTAFLEAGWNGQPTIVSAARAEEVLAAAGMPAPAQAGVVVTHCQSGIRSTLPSLVLTALGYTVRMYDASMADYLSNPANKVSTGAA